MRNPKLPVVEMSASSLVVWAMVLFLIPLPWTVAWIVSVLIHELSHYLAVRICGGNILAVRINAGGVSLETGVLSDGKSIVCLLAGPIGGLLLLSLSNIFPRVALCGLIHSAYNLIPVYPLDGGRVLRKGLAFLPFRKTTQIIEIVLLLVVVGTCIWFAIRYSFGILPLLLAAGFVLQSRKAKVP